MIAMLTLRAVFLVVILIGLVVNIVEFDEAIQIRRRLRRSRTNGLRQQASNNLLMSARYRLIGSVLLAIVVGVLFMAPSPRPDAFGFAVIARVAFIGLSVTFTAAGFAARRGRLDIVDLIESTDWRDKEAL